MGNQLLLDMLYNDNFEAGLKYIYLNKDTDIPTVFFEDFISCYIKSLDSAYDKDESVLYTVLTILNNKNAFKLINTIIKRTKKKNYIYLYNDLILSRKVTLEEFLTIEDKVKYPHSMLFNLHTDSEEEELILFKYIIKNLHETLDKLNLNFKLTYFIIPEILNNSKFYIERIGKFNHYLLDRNIDRVSLLMIENPFYKYGNSTNTQSKSKYRYKFESEYAINFYNLKSTENLSFKRANNVYTKDSEKFNECFEIYNKQILLNNKHNDWIGKNKHILEWFRDAVVPFDSYKPTLIQANNVNLFLFEFYIKEISNDVKEFILSDISRLFSIYSRETSLEFKNFSILYSLFGNSLIDKMLDGSVIAKIPLQDNLSNSFPEFKKLLFTEPKYIKLFDYVVLYSYDSLMRFIRELSDNFNEKTALSICKGISCNSLEISLLLGGITYTFKNKLNAYSFNFYLSLIDILMDKKEIDCLSLKLKDYFICLPEYEQYFEVLKKYEFKKLEN